MSVEIDRGLLRDQAALLGVTLDETALERFSLYARMLVEWNEKVNLTAITAPEDIVRKHFVDSLTLLPLLPESDHMLIDVGTGAGFPGVPLAIVRHGSPLGGIRLTLLDSLNKRLAFLKELCDALELPVTLIHARAEEAGQKPELRESFDVATARAVAALPTLCEYCMPFVRIGGRFIAMKGPEGEAEAGASQKAVALLGGKLGKVESRQITGREETLERRLILVDKISQTPVKYPRISSKIKKQPL